MAPRQSSTFSAALALRILASLTDKLYVHAQTFHTRNRLLGHTKTPHTTTRRALYLMLTGLLLTACGGATPAKTYTVGVVNYVPALEPVLTGFKARMAALGHVEGKNITYIYHGVLKPEPQVIEHEVKRLLDQKVDLCLTLGTRPALVAKKAL